MSLLLAVLIPSLFALAPLKKLDTQVYRFTGVKGFEQKVVGNTTFDLDAGRHCHDLLEVIFFEDDSVEITPIDSHIIHRSKTDASEQAIEVINDKEIELHSEGHRVDNDESHKWKYTCDYARIL